MFLWKDFSMGQIRKIQKTKKERMEERKRRDFLFLFFIFLTYMEGPILMCSPLVGNALGYRLYAILPEENPLGREPPPTTFGPFREI
jgi:hypothetical protein